MKLKISQIKNQIERNVYGVQSVLKQQGTNTWMIRVISFNHLEDIKRDLDKIGFNVMLANEFNKVIYAEYMGDLENTHYGRQVKTWREKLNA
jgi:hypothetical protein